MCGAAFWNHVRLRAGWGIDVHLIWVAAALCRLGLNGQLFTAQSGSHCRISVFTTNAALAFPTCLWGCQSAAGDDGRLDGFDG
jgi:hypothetical protein